MSGTTPRRRHGLAGLLVALFVVGGLIFSYGLGHAPPARICTEHAVSVPVGVAAAVTGQQAPETGVPPLQELHKLAGTALTGPMKQRPPQAPMDVCLCLAVLFTLVLLGLAGGLRRTTVRLPARIGWTLASFNPGACAPASQRPLQVLRL